MSFLRNLSIRNSIISALIFIELIIFGISVDKWQNSVAWYEQTQKIHEITSTKAIALERAYIFLLRVRLGAAVYSFAGDTHQRDQQELMHKLMPPALKNVEAQLAVFDSIKLPDPEGQQLSDQLLSQFRGYLDNFVRPAYEAAMANDVEKMKAIQVASTQGSIGLTEALTKFKSYSDTMTTELMAQADAALKRSQIIAGVILLASVALGALLYVGFTRALIIPLKQIVQHFRQIAQGDLSVKIRQHGKSEIHVVLQALAQMQSGLADIIYQVRKSSDNINRELAEITAGNKDLSARTESQASNLEETAASMEQLSSTVKTNAENALLANDMAADASSIAGQGGEKMQAVVETMEEIAHSSRQISDIISVIDGIAFQTNILALNAAVEAARAGEQGRGFAVVAGEVRSLAQRSAEAARQIKMLIGSSVQKVEAGTAQVYDAGSAMQKIVAQVKEVSQLISDISTATSEQSSGISQIGIAVSQLDEATQQNASLVEKSSASVDSLREQILVLSELTRVFKLDHETRNAALPNLG